jgi:hypothetical protein
MTTNCELFVHAPSDIPVPEMASHHPSRPPLVFTFHTL